MKKLNKKLFILKYIFSIILTMLAAVKVKNGFFFLGGILDIFLIFLITSVFISNKKLGTLFNSILILFYNIQVGVLFFANSFVSMIMLNNLDSIDALAGKALIYISAIIIVFAFSFLPIKSIKFTSNKKRYFSTFLGITLYCISIFFAGISYSPVYGYINLANQYSESLKLQKGIQEAVSLNTDAAYYNNEIANYREKDSNLSEKPNVVLIFVEGLSQNIIDDKRNIMSNVYKYQNKSLSFINYYNHTFATYRGLIGQLFSGYQLNNYDTNKLISLQDILENNGYSSTWINSEPKKADFADYVNTLGFDEVITDERFTGRGTRESIADKDMFETLFSTMENKSNSKKPFFISMYTFGTHATLDSVDKKFGNGKNAELNKFYDFDYQFGEFMKKFETSHISDNTILVFTTDHATYADDSFTESFPNYSRTFGSLDEIPFFIYYKGISPEKIDVNGRNSICLAPTILDYLDISAENYFVGTSLFSDKVGSVCEVNFTDSFVYVSSENDSIHSISDEDLQEFNDMIEEYYITKEIIANKNK